MCFHENSAQIEGGISSNLDSSQGAEVSSVGNAPGQKPTQVTARLAGKLSYEFMANDFGLVIGSETQHNNLNS